jgi:hypothetical protein
MFSLAVNTCSFEFHYWLQYWRTQPSTLVHISVATISKSCEFVACACFIFNNNYNEFTMSCSAVVLLVG